MNEPNYASCKAIKALHVRVNRIEKYLNKYIPSEANPLNESLLTQYINIIHQDIDKRALTNEDVVKIHKALEQAYDRISRSIRDLGLDNPDNIISEQEKRNSVKGEIWAAVRAKMKGCVVKKCTFQNLLKKLRRNVDEDDK